MQYQERNAIVILVKMQIRINGGNHFNIFLKKKLEFEKFVKKKKKNERF